MTELILEVRDLRVCYGNLTAVEHASMTVERGSVTSLIGVNGSGKSTLLNAVAGLIRPAAGEILFRGENIAGLSADQVVRRGLALVPQGGRCFPRMTVEENLIMGSYPGRARKHAKTSLERVYHLFPVLMEKRKKSAGTLSGGQKQMAAIGRALMSEPECVLFDEISLGLAPVGVRDLYERIQQINTENGTAVLFVEQDTERALRSSSFCHVMSKGQTVLSDRSENITMEQIRSVYFGKGGQDAGGYPPTDS